MKRSATIGAVGRFALGHRHFPQFVNYLKSTGRPLSSFVGVSIRDLGVSGVVKDFLDDVHAYARLLEADEKGKDERFKSHVSGE